MFLKRLRFGLRTLFTKRKAFSLDKLEVDFDSFQKGIGIHIKNRSLFAQALIHRSFLSNGISEDEINSNERLEFFGDAVLSMIVSEYLYEKFPDANEGELTKLRARLINKKALSLLANQIQLPSFLFLSPSARQSMEQGYDSFIADAFEAIVAAIYLDSGYDAAQNFVREQITDAVGQGNLELFNDDNYKSLLIEYTQGRNLGIPRYEIINREGPDHDQTFTVGVKIGNTVYGTGKGKSKKEAEQNAASYAFKQLIKEEHLKQSNNE